MKANHHNVLLVGFWLFIIWLLLSIVILLSPFLINWVRHVSSFAAYCIIWLNQGIQYSSENGFGAVVLLLVAQGAILFMVILQRIRAAKLMGRLSFSVPPESVSQFAKEHSMENRLSYTQSKQIFSFTSGFFHPRIVISQGMVELLNEKQLHAVLLHERMHAIGHHPLLLALARSFAKVFWFFPIVGEIVRQYQILLELDADQFAIRHVGKEHLAAALLAVMEVDLKHVHVHEVAWNGFDDFMRPRVYQLIGQEARRDVKRKWMIRSTIQSGTSFLLFILLLVASCL
ncbi:M56 family metallopeptidase [Ferroacidibacillus organovorans]|uniref:Peptidase M56 domain-containing protein n=2 Tax=Ferroacidibacillus organovorans TaxID=1765683 RepID=A0A853KB23_9BACL|nr:M56 family metallopeptidase [Ferroacidibacillus organovorans]KYP80226.1 hypothetical protein AYJ22_12210 [Ferroacidibacillus organovorans]OAG93608.1 hypothetical protein AYW79_09625 [Ferroacidibacillus organovorans]